jgi:hypothetical protein
MLHGNAPCREAEAFSTARATNPNPTNYIGAPLNERNNQHHNPTSDIDCAYTRAPDSYITATNINLAVQQVIHMEKPAKPQAQAQAQAQELKAIYAVIDSGNEN